MLRRLVTNLDASAKDRSAGRGIDH